MSRAEFVAGLRRLAVLIVGLGAVALIVSWGFVASGATAQRGASAGLGVVGMLLVITGVGAYARTSPARRTPDGIRLADRTERREAEGLTGGLLGLGIMFCLVSLGMG